MEIVSSLTSFVLFFFSFKIGFLGIVLAVLYSRQAPYQLGCISANPHRKILLLPGGSHWTISHLLSVASSAVKIRNKRKLSKLDNYRETKVLLLILLRVGPFCVFVFEEFFSHLRKPSWASVLIFFRTPTVYRHFPWTPISFG